jgi:hypothetical protein
MQNTEIVIAAIEARAVRDVLALLVKGRAIGEVGKRALLLAWLMDPALVGKTQRDLARRMGVTEGRASQMLKAIRSKFPH